MPTANPERLRTNRQVAVRCTVSDTQRSPCATAESEGHCGSVGQKAQGRVHADCASCSRGDRPSQPVDVRRLLHAEGGLGGHESTSHVLLSKIRLAPTEEMTLTVPRG